ncbi:MAG TPA: hypothetical protein VK395_21545 [Gemmataceae bacterium]|nr:hypothetical protein [Gemmataceae bacterium]
MSTIITGVVTNGVVIPSSPLPEGAPVEIHLRTGRPEVAPGAAARLTAGELRKMPRAERQAVLAAAAALAEEDYRDDKELTGFDAFTEEEVDDDESP